MKKILVTGANGQLGSTLQRMQRECNADFTFVDKEELDFNNFNEIEEFFSKNKFEFCINTAAYTAVDLAETEVELSNKINADAVDVLSKSCLENNIHLIHISTDFVFDGKKSFPYKETDKPNPINQYGKGKLIGEGFTLKNNGTVIRTSWLYSEYGKNFVRTMLSLSKNRDELGVISDQIGTPTYCGDLAKCILEIIFSKDASIFRGEVFHYSNEGVASWYDFAKTIFEYSNTPIKVLSISSKEFKSKSERPSYSVLDKKKIKSKLNTEIPYWRESLKKCLQNL